MITRQDIEYRIAALEKYQAKVPTIDFGLELCRLALLGLEHASLMEEVLAARKMRDVMNQRKPFPGNLQSDSVGDIFIFRPQKVTETYDAIRKRNTEGVTPSASALGRNEG